MTSWNRRQIEAGTPATGTVGNAVGIGLPLLTVLGWGASFPVAKAILPAVNAFYLSTERYALASLLFAVILVAIEGNGALRFEGKFTRAFLLGSTGFAGFGLLAFLGLSHTRPQNAALFVATMPLLTALVLWVRRGQRPTAATIGFMMVALAGVGLVITRGNLALVTSGRIGVGDVMVLLGVLCWVVYMLGASSLPTWSPLRYTTLTSLAGTTTIVAVTAVATALGAVAAPSMQQTAGVAWQIAYMVVPGTVVAVLTWNAGIKRLGPQNTVLFINLVPVITLVIEIARGYYAAWIEIVGVTVTIAALVGNDLWQRRTASGAPRRVRSATSKAA